MRLPCSRCARLEGLPNVEERAVGVDARRRRLNGVVRLVTLRCRDALEVSGRRARSVAAPELRALVGAGPGAHDLAAEECPDRGDRTNGVEGTLVVPPATACIRNGVREGEEELHVPLEPMLLIAVVVAA